jgi:Lyzozyme M1 (1,4-beta-N-acetylmuramidase)
MTLKFVDVASHQGNYIVGSNGEEGVIVKATQGTGYVNPTLDFVAQQAISKGIPWGIYHYAGGDDANAEADKFIQAVQGYLSASNPPNLILDWEEYQNAAYSNGAWAETFLKRIKDKTGLQAGIYGNSGDLSQMTQWVVDNAWIWFAGYPYAAGTTSMIQDWSYPSFPYSSGKFKTITGWQFSSQPLDKSVFYVTSEQWRNLGTQNNNYQLIQPTKENSTMIYAFNVQGQGATYLFDGQKTIVFAEKTSGSGQGPRAWDHYKGTYKEVTGKDLPTQTKTKEQFELWNTLYPAQFIKF